MRLPGGRRLGLGRLGTRAFWISPLWVVAASLIAVLVLHGLGVRILDLLELKTYDLRFLSRGRRPPSPAVAMVVIDEKSLEGEGRWPWPRSKIAAIVDALSRDGAKVIGFDVLFAEPDTNSRLGFIDELVRELDTLAVRDARLRAFVRERRRDADNDAALADAITRSHAAVVLGYFFHDPSTLAHPVGPAEAEARLREIAPSKYPLVRRTAQAMAEPVFITGVVPQTNLAILRKAAASSGFFSLQGDRDGVLRWMPLVVRGGDELFPPLALVCAWEYLGRPPLTVEIGRHGIEGVRMGERFVPTDEVGKLLINYLGPPKTFPSASATDVIAGRFAPGTFEDRVVLVGATAVATYDLRSTPFDPRYPGTEVHATVVDNILTQRFMARPEWWRAFDVLAMAAMTAFAGLALGRLGPINGLLFAAGLFAVYIAAVRWLFVSGRMWLGMVYPLLAVVTVYVAMTVYSYVTEQRERKKIKSTFKQYVAEHVVEEMIKDPSRLKLGGEEKVLTVLFSDLEGFTRYSERHTPHEMTEMLAEYYNRITARVFEERGTLKEYVGDELMAFFGAPLDDGRHAERACAAALAMRADTRALADEWAAIGRPRIRARTGINSGPMVVGNLGSRYRFAYGVVGDHVNLGSRLEGLNKVYGTDIIIGENTASLVEATFRLRELDMVRVIGRSQVVHIYELVATADTALPATHDEALTLYAAALAAYRKGAWPEALDLFEQALRARPDDGPSRALARRCLEYREAPPERWDGVFDQRVK